MQREILRPQVNIPLVLKLDFGPEGSEREGKFGPQWMYTVNDDQAILFLPVEGRSAILASGAEAGDEIALCKRAKGRWEAQRVSDAAEVPEEPKPAAATHKPVRYMTGSKAAFPASKYAQGVPQTDSPLPATDGHGRVNGKPVQQNAVHANGTTHSPRSGDALAPLSGNNPTALHLGECMKIAIDACLIAQEYAREKNFGLTFLGDTVKSLAVTVFIRDQENR